MSSLFKLKRIDTVVEGTMESTATRFAHVVPYAVFQQYHFRASVKLYSPTCDFLKTPMILKAWTVTSDKNPVSMQTNITTTAWIEVMGFKQTNSIYWPEIQQADILQFKHDVLFVVKSIEALAESHEIYLVLE